MNFGMRPLWEKTKKVLSKELKVHTSPSRASFSLAAGVLVGLSPFYGFHTVIVLALAFVLRLNRPLALVASGITFFPFVPLWIAGGIIAGKTVVPIEAAGRIIDMAVQVMSAGRFWGLSIGVIEFSRRFFPRAIFDLVDEEASHGVLDGFVQWFIGCSILAVAGAVVTFCACYFLLLRRAVVREKKRQ
jgi:hypothetical protein